MGMRGVIGLVVCALVLGCGASSVHRGGGDGTNDAGGNGGAGGGGGGAPTFASSCNGALTTITGTITAPNGHDPVANAFGYIPLSTTPIQPGVACELCATPADGAAATATTDASGKFIIDIGNVPIAATLYLTVNKGRFRRTTSIAITPCMGNAASAAATTLPSKSGTGDDIPKIAVATGNKDQLDVVLAALGLDAQQGFDCYEGRASSSTTLKSPCGMRGTTLQPIESLLKNEAMLAQYNLVFLSCAPGKFKALSVADQQAIAGNLRTWTQKGGRLFVTDNSYDYVAQSFPDAIAFLNGNSAVDAANVGYGTSGSGTSYAGQINDATLAAWLAAVGAIPAGSNSVTLGGYLNNWSVIQSLPMSTIDVVDATNAQAYPTGSTTPGPAATYPQAVRFDVPATGSTQACGRVIYSSYHTLPTTTQPDPTQLATQERILEYLMLEAGACVGPIG